MNEAWADKLSDATEQEWTKGWYDSDEFADREYTKKFDETPIYFGTAIQVNAVSEDAGFIFSGAVKQAPTINDVANFMAIANCTPVDITLGDVKVNCDETTRSPDEGWLPGQDCVNLLDDRGNNKVTLVYVNEAWADKLSDATEQEWTKGWYDADEFADREYTKKYDNEPILAGEGVQVNVSGDTIDATVQIDPAL